MMIHGYTIDVYCDEVAWHKDAQFGGKDLGTCLRLARAQGWLISRSRVLCPECARKVRRTKKAKKKWKESPDE